MKKKLLAITLLSIGALLLTYRTSIIPQFFKPTESVLEETVVSREAKPPRVIADGLSIPWELAFLPGGDLLVTERAGKLLRISAENRTLIEISGVAHRGEGGLLGLTLHPDFEKNQLLYIYLTTGQGTELVNRVERYKLEGASLSERTVIIDSIPGASYHDGGRIAFGPDNMLYITTGDAGTEASAQNTNSLAGKILRVNTDGSIPSDNPFKNAVYSYGHRNVQGIAWDNTGQLWATEHGRSGLESGFDEVNKIVKGGNYGWPSIEGNETAPGMLPPALHSGPNETWAPSGMAYANGSLLFAGLRGEALYRIPLLNGTAVVPEKYFAGTYGRLRTVAQSEDGTLYLLTNNRDGRGTPVATDDRIIAIDPKSFK